MPIRSQRHRTEIQGGGIGGNPVIAAWAAGAGTLTPVPVVAGKARCEALGTENPRIVKKITNLVPGKSYQIDTTHTMGNTANSAFYRVDDTSDMPDGTYANQAMSANGGVQMIFTAPAGGIVYYGVVQLVDNPGDFCQTADTFTLTRLP